MDVIGNLGFEIANLIARSFFDMYDAVKKVYSPSIYSEEMLHTLMEDLISKGYPLDSFDLQCPVAKYFASYAKDMTPDITVLNPDTMDALAFFRVYESVDDFQKDNLYDGAYHLNKHSNILLCRPYYVVVKNNNQLCYFNLRSLLQSGKTLDLSSSLGKPLNYKVLASNDVYRMAHNQLIDKAILKKIGRFLFSFAIPAISVFLLVLDGLKIYEITEIRLILLGIIIISFLIPYLAQVTIKDFSVSFKEHNK